MILLLPLLLLIAGGLGLVLWALRRREIVRVDAWQAVVPRNTARSVVASGDQFGVAIGLGRVEMRCLVTSVSFAVGILLSLLAVFTLATGGPDNRELIARVVRHLGLVAYPLAGMTLLAANRATLRSRREGTEELFTTTPTNPTTRTGAHLLAVSAGIGAASILMAASLVVIRLKDGFGPLGHGWIAEALAGVALVAGAAALGVLLARWLPHGIVAPLALVAILLATLALNGVRPFTNPAHAFAPWPSPEPDLASDFVMRASWSHLVYLVGLVALVAVVAIARTGRGRLVIGALAAAIALTGAGSLLQTRSMSDENATRIAALISAPATHQTCRTHAGVRACAYPGYTELLDDWTQPAVRVRAALPDTRRDREYRIVQRVGEAGLPYLDPKVRNRLELAAWHSDDGVEHPGFTAQGAKLGFALLPAQWAVDLPLTTAPGRVPCYAGNQARAVVALWLAGQAVDRETALDAIDPLITVDNNGASWHSKRAPWALIIWADTWEADTDAPVVWARSDLAVARQLLLRPRAEVRTALHADWDHLTAPTTTTSELVAALGLRTVDTAKAARVPAGLDACR